MVSCVFGGRLGNIILEIYTVFWYCHKNNINFNNIVFSNAYDGYGTEHKKYNSYVKDYIKNNAEILLNQNLYRHFIPASKFNAIFAECRKTDLTNVFYDKNYNILFQEYTYHYPETYDDVMLFRKLFDIYYVKDFLYMKYREKYFNKKSIALHIRRTDYEVFKNGKYMQSKCEIMNSIKKIINNVFINIICFSDDIPWCQKNIVGNNIFYHNDCLSTCQDMLLMSLCSDIISNPHSSFSYCSKLLNHNINYIPKRAPV